MVNMWHPLLAAIVAFMACVGGVMTWYLSQPGLRSFLIFRSCRLLSKEKLVNADGPRLAVYRFTFALPEGGTDLNLDLSVGEHVKIRGTGFRARSYSPVAARPGEFDLIIKVYPAGPAAVSSYLEGLREGEYAQMSGPYPPRPFLHQSRDGGRHVGIVAFGVGITEALEVIRGELQRREADEVVLVWALRDRSEAYAEAELAALAVAATDGTTGTPRLRMHKYFSREKGRRLGEAELYDFFPWTSKSAEDLRFLVVGTKQMNEKTYQALTNAGLAHRKLLKKRPGPGFGSSAQTQHYLPVPSSTKI